MPESQFSNQMPEVIVSPLPLNSALSQEMHERYEQERDRRLEEIIRQANMLTKNGGTFNAPSPRIWDDVCAQTSRLLFSRVLHLLISP